MKRTTALAVAAGVALCLAALAAQGPARAWITVLSTTDLHGNLLPIDYYTDRPDARGLAKVATLVRQARAENPAGTLLLNSGDTIQGTPLAYVHNRRNNRPPDPMMLAMNALGFDAMAIGNHEYNFGLPVLQKARGEARFPWLSANTYKTGTQDTAFQPYLVKELNGVRVGVVGLTTPGIPFWDDRENYAGLEFREPVAEARKWVAALRGAERADLVVAAMHMGIEADLKTGERLPGQVTNENMALAIAREVPGIDVIVMGHTHQEVPGLVVNGVLLTQASMWGRHLARADVHLQKDGSGRWRVDAKQARTIPVTADTAIDPEIAKLTEPYDAETRAWLARVVGESEADSSAADASFRDTAIMDLIQRVQLDAGRADVSLAANFNPQARLPKGPVTVRDIAGLYIYENTLVVLEVSGQQLKDALEHSARYFGAFVAGRTPAELVDPRVPGYNFDMAEGVTYDLDISRPIGDRIRDLSFKGQPVTAGQRLRLATNNYRANGGGGYTMLSGAREVMRTSTEIRELIIDWVEKNRRVPANPSNNWRLVQGR